MGIKVTAGTEVLVVMIIPGRSADIAALFCSTNTSIQWNIYFEDTGGSTILSVNLNKVSFYMNTEYI